MKKKWKLSKESYEREHKRRDKEFFFLRLKLSCIYIYTVHTYTQEMYRAS